MAKHQKPKPASAKGVQKNHNKATKGVNSRKRGPLWAVRRAIVRNKKTGEEREVSYQIRVPHNTLYNPELVGRKNLPEPFDALKLDWVDELAHYLANSSYKLYRETIDEGLFEYRVRNEEGDLIFSLISSRNAFIENKPRRRRKRGHKK